MDDASAASEGEARLVSCMVAYQAGEVDGFSDLYAELASDVERYFTASVGSTAAEDLAQETFLEIHRSRRSYCPPRPVRPWVFGLARNVLKRHRRSTWRRERRETAAGVASPVAAGPFEGGHAAGDLREALSQLPANRREAWLLHHQQGWSFQEIATRLSIGVDAAKRRASRAMGDLRRALGLAAKPADSGDDEEGDPHA